MENLNVWQVNMKGIFMAGLDINGMTLMGL